MAALPPGTALSDGVYILEEVLGRGGFGITYRASDTRSSRPVAIKECFPSGCERQGTEVHPGDFYSSSHLESFKYGLRQQARILEHLTHPAIVSVVETFDANNTVYMVMDLVEGETLHQYIEKRGALPPEEATAWLEPIAGAVAAVHHAGLLHLDIKPENAIVVDESAHALVLVDFDLAQSQELDDFRTRPLALATQCGTPGYAPLEQYAQHARLTRATDVYALGATLYHLLTGQVPNSAVDRAAGEALRLPSAVTTGLPADLEAGVLAALAIKPDERPPDIESFLKALQPAPPLVTPDEDDDAFIPPVTPQFMAHNAGMIHRIVLNTETPVWPKRCVCCFERAETDYTLNSPSGRWSLPLCHVCEKHQQLARQAGRVTTIGLTFSVVVALVAVAASVLAESFWPIFLGPVGIMTNFISMNYGGLKNSRAEETMRDTCSDLSQPVTYNFNGRVHIWRFKNARFAEEFRKRNAAFVV